MTLSNLFLRFILFYDKNLKRESSSLQEVLKANKQLRWLDLGSSSRISEGFHFADLHAPSESSEAMGGRYFQFNMVTATENDLRQLGKWDLIRMQHVFEHLTIEDGLIGLEKCWELLNEGGYLLITVPDLNIFIDEYRNGTLHTMDSFKDWALTRIPKDAPESFYFSIFTHSVLHQQHMWCYDEEGLKFQLSRTGKFKNIKRLSVFHPLAGVPFTHNRPLEDLCILAQKA